MTEEEIWSKKVDLEKLLNPKNHFYPDKNDYSEDQLLCITDTVNRILENGKSKQTEFCGLVRNAWDEVIAMFSEFGVMDGGYTFFWREKEPEEKVLNLC